jgi:hypothetical protein
MAFQFSSFGFGISNPYSHISLVLDNKKTARRERSGLQNNKQKEPRLFGAVDLLGLLAKGLHEHRISLN